MVFSALGAQEIITSGLFTESTDVEINAGSLAKTGMFDTKASPVESPDLKGPGSGFYWGLDDVLFYWAWGADAFPSGLVLKAGYKENFLEKYDTDFFAIARGGYGGETFLRGTDFTPHINPFDTGVLPAGITEWGPYNKVNFDAPQVRWELGVKQGLLWSDKTDKNLLEAILMYRGRYDNYLTGRIIWGTDENLAAVVTDLHEAWRSEYQGTDANGILGNSLLIGLLYDTISKNEVTKVYDGLYAEISAEFSPYFEGLSDLGASDFWRVTGSAKGFIPLYNAAPEAGTNLISVYLADYFSIDYSAAEKSMPLYVMKSFGGTGLRTGLAGGKGVRGFETNTWDTELKVVNNLEIRCNLPALYFRNIVPGILVFIDAGYGYGFWHAPAPYNTMNTVLASTGFAIYLNLFDLATVTATSSFPLYGNRLDGKKYSLFGIGFGLHF